MSDSIIRWWPKSGCTMSIDSMDDAHAKACRELREWRRASEFYRQCKADPTSHETGAMRDAVEWLTSLASREMTP